MKDTRSQEIKKLLKVDFPEALFRVRIHKYSMGEAIYVKTNLVKREQLRVEFNVPVIGHTEETKNNIQTIKEKLTKYQSIDRDQWGEIMSGGNTFLFVEEL